MSTDLYLSFDAVDVIAPFALLISPDGTLLRIGAILAADAREGRLSEIVDRCARIESLWAESAPFLWQIVERRGPR